MSLVFVWICATIVVICIIMECGNEYLKSSNEENRKLHFIQVLNVIQTINTSSLLNLGNESG